MAEIEARKKEKVECKSKSVDKNEFDDPEAEGGNKAESLLLLVCVSFTIIGQPRNSVLIRRV